MINRQVFFGECKRTIFQGRFSQKQVDGINDILGAWEASNFSDIRYWAYSLATTWLETAHTMQPIKEYGGRKYFMRMYDKTGERPHIAKQLGNTQVGDGAKFCGRGDVQLTGRANYTKAAKKLDIDCVNKPDLVLKQSVASRIMIAGMTCGWFTGKKLSDYLTGKTTDYKNCRRIINGTDRAAEIAAKAKSFENALTQASSADETKIAATPAKVTTGKPPYKSKTNAAAVGTGVVVIGNQMTEIVKTDKITEVTEKLGAVVDGVKKVQELPFDITAYLPYIIIVVAVCGVGFIIWDRWQKSQKDGV